MKKSHIENYDIVHMDDELLPEIEKLFEYIYPNNPEIAKKLCYKNDADNHIVTLLAKYHEELIGQANIFIKQISDGIINIGFHVHPSFRHKGLATRLVSVAINNAIEKGYKKFHIITDSRNTAAKCVALKLKFKIDSSINVPQHTVYKLKISYRDRNGLFGGEKKILK